MIKAPKPSPYKPGQLRILVAEDNPVNQRIAVSFVEKMGLSVQAVGNGVEALEALKEHAEQGTPFDLVLMDVQMPIMDGYEATKILRMDTNKIVRDVTVIAMTASAIQGDKEKCLQVGMNDYLGKFVFCVFCVFSGMQGVMGANTNSETGSVGNSARKAGAIPHLGSDARRSSYDTTGRQD